MAFGQKIKPSILIGPKNKIPEVFITKKKAKNMNHGSPLFPTKKILLCHK